jgi:hypothetical protein
VRATDVEDLGDGQTLKLRTERVPPNRPHVALSKRTEHGQHANHGHLLPQLDSDVLSSFDADDRVGECSRHQLCKAAHDDPLMCGLPLDHSGLDPERRHIGDAIV